VLALLAALSGAILLLLLLARLLAAALLLAGFLAGLIALLLLALAFSGLLVLTHSASFQRFARRLLFDTPPAQRGNNAPARRFVPRVP
jgi:hypothetical protein